MRKPDEKKMETNARPTIDEATKYESGFYDDLAALIRSTADGS